MHYLQSQNLLRCENCQEVGHGHDSSHSQIKCNLCLLLNESEDLKSAELPSEVQDVFESILSMDSGSAVMSVT